MKTFLFLLLFLFSGLAQSNIFDMGEHSGFIKDSSGNLYKVNAAGTVSAINTGNTLAVTEKVNIPTSKGFYSSEIVRSAPVEISRLGKTVRTIAAASGPVGLTISAVSLVCELTTICDQAGQWLIGGGDPLVGDQIDPTYSGNWYTSTNVLYPTAQSAADAQCPLSGLIAPAESIIFAGGVYYNIYCHNSSGGLQLTGAIRLLGSSYVGSPRAPTTADWDTKESLLNDSRFIDPLLEKGSPVPVSSPQITTPVKVPLGSETKTMKDGTGNVTGTETTITEAEISQPSGSENPTGSPSLIKITENTTVNNYNTSNQLTSSTTTVSSTQTPVQTAQEPITISIDNVPDQELQTYASTRHFQFYLLGLRLMSG